MEWSSAEEAQGRRVANLRITSNGDNFDTQVTDATPSNSSTSITAGSSSLPLTRETE